MYVFVHECVHVEIVLRMNERVYALEYKQFCDTINEKLLIIKRKGKEVKTIEERN